MLLSGHVTPGSPFCFLFIDRQLERILATNFGPNYPLDDSLEAATRATPLTIQEFRERSQDQLDSYRRAQEKQEPNIVLAPFMLFDRSDDDRELYIWLMDKYDATRLHPGDTMQESNAQFGGAIGVSRDADEMILTYGRGIDDSPYPAPFV